MMQDISVGWIQFLLARVRIFLIVYPVELLLPNLRSIGSSDRDKFHR
jgi:hypothetical protein